MLEGETTLETFLPRSAGWWLMPDGAAANFSVHPSSASWCLMVLLIFARWAMRKALVWL
jgi:hypothetical protein